MLELEIKDKTYLFNFGLGFVKEINPTCKRVEEGVSEDVGLEAAIIKLKTGDIIALFDVLMVANKYKEPRITAKELEEYLDNPDTDIDALFEQVLDFFRHSNAIKKKMSLMEKALEMIEN